MRKYAAGERHLDALPRSNHWEVRGRPQCDKCGCRVRNCSQHRFTPWRQFQTEGTAIRGFSSGHPRGTTPADDRYILTGQKKQAAATGEIARHDTGDWTTDIAFYQKWPEDCTVMVVCLRRRPVWCVPLTPAHRRRRSLCAGNTGIGETMNGDEYSLQMRADSV
ncbi:transposable element Tcb1 transposase [Trichonephila clavipes]|nr:transposable element Tcb1 transposase [Trichonephila clavipes]